VDRVLHDLLQGRPRGLSPRAQEPARRRAEQPLGASDAGRSRMRDRCPSAGQPTGSHLARRLLLTLCPVPGHAATPGGTSCERRRSRSRRARSSSGATQTFGTRSRRNRSASARVGAVGAAGERRDRLELARIGDPDPPDVNRDTLRPCSGTRSERAPRGDAGDRSGRPTESATPPDPLHPAHRHDVGRRELAIGASSTVAIASRHRGQREMRARLSRGRSGARELSGRGH
jgi:hypothetical protein